MTILMDVAVVGLPLTGKASTMLSARQHFPCVAQGVRPFGYRGFMGKQLSVLLAPAPELLLFLRTFSGSVWSPSAWKLQVATADAIIYVVDSQPGMTQRQEAFDSVFFAMLPEVLFAPDDVPILIQTNKSDLSTSEHTRALRAKDEALGYTTIDTCALRGTNIDASIRHVAALLRTRISNQVTQLSGEIGLRLSAWDPFTAPKGA